LSERQFGEKGATAYRLHWARATHGIFALEVSVDGGRGAIKTAVDAALARVDDFVSGAEVKLPSAAYRRAIDTLLESGSGSARTAALFFAFYWLEVPSWDFDTVPIGIRGKSGDKLLSEGLTNRSITLHNAITAFGENLGFKGNVRKSMISQHRAFSAFVSKIKSADLNERSLIADYFAQRFAESKREATPLPPVSSSVLTFARAKELFYALEGLHTEGHVQQFLIVALLAVFRRPQRIKVRTHHPHAADRSDDAAGDIEELQDDTLVRAYEVTVRDDWKNRISNFKSKMDRFGLKKYTIIARGVNSDSTWSEPAKVVLALEPYGRDIAVIDILDVLNFFAAELSAEDLRSAVNLTYEMLSDRKLSGRHEFKEKYVETVRQWLDVTP